MSEERIEELENKLLDILRLQEDQKMLASTLVEALRNQGISDMDAREALWHLLGEEQVELTSDRRVVLHAQEAA